MIHSETGLDTSRGYRKEELASWRALGWEFINAKSGMDGPNSATWRATTWTDPAVIADCEMRTVMAGFLQKQQGRSFWEDGYGGLGKVGSVGVYAALPSVQTETLNYEKLMRTIALVSQGCAMQYAGINGMDVVVSSLCAAVPKMTLSGAVPVTPEFRAEINAWMLQFFGTEDTVFAVRGADGSKKLVVSPARFESLRQY